MWFTMESAGKNTIAENAVLTINHGASDLNFDDMIECDDNVDCKRQEPQLRCWGYPIQDTCKPYIMVMYCWAA